MKVALTVRAGLVAVAMSIFTSAMPSVAATFTFNTAPFAGTTALTDPGRQVVGNELFIPDFNVATDVFAFDAAAFGIDSLSFQNSLAADLPASGVNVVVVRDTDNDNNPATAFNAGAAANVIAARISTPGAGLFVYWNSALNVNRLVYSTNLDDNTADLSVVARIVSPTGADAIASLPLFGASNFAVPAPSAGALLALAGLGMTRRRR